MVIHEANFGRPGFGPAKDNPPLVVDPNGMKAGVLPSQRLKSISRWHRQIGKQRGPVQLNELAKRQPGDGRKTPVSLLVKKLPGIRIGEGLNHVGTGSEQHY